MSKCPPAPQSEQKQDLGFERKKMVAWFDPMQLVRTGLKTLLSSLFGAYSDKREMQSALHMDFLAGDLHHDPKIPDNHISDHVKVDMDYSLSQSIWFDYIGDTGDGFNSTYTMAQLLATERLKITETDSLERGRFLVLGGDQVYPAASRDEYLNRFLGPFRAALPWVDEQKQIPEMFAIPGNHDWYDGLTSFIRLFCQGRWVGGWKTQQKFSYFALKLPHHWWLWGIDLQLEADIDKPQLDYFRKIVAQHVQTEDQIILCTGAPHWLEADSEDEQGFANIYHFIEETLGNAKVKKGKVKVILTGDLHHYCHYEFAPTGPDLTELLDDPAQADHLITSGGGGAYLYPTHHLPETLSLFWPPRNPPYQRKQKRQFRRQAIFPAESQSRRMRWGVFWFHFKNLGFGTLLALLYLLYAWLLQSTSKSINPSNSQDPLGATFIEEIVKLRPWVGSDIGAMLYQFWLVFARGPELVGLTVLIVASLAMFAYSCGGKKWHSALGFLHGGAHIIMNLFLIWGCALFNQWLLADSFKADGFASVVLMTGEMFVLGGVLGGGLMGLYLFLSEFVPSRWKHTRLHSNEVFSAQQRADYKNFLRLHISEQGRLTVYAVGVSKVGTDWKLNKQATGGQSWFEPTTSIEPHLIDRIEVS